MLEEGGGEDEPDVVGGGIVVLTDNGVEGVIGVVDGVFVVLGRVNDDVGDFVVDGEELVVGVLVITDIGSGDLGQTDLDRGFVVRVDGGDKTQEGGFFSNSSPVLPQHVIQMDERFCEFELPVVVDQSSHVRVLFFPRGSACSP